MKRFKKSTDFINYTPAFKKNKTKSYRMKGVGGYIYASFIIQFIVYPPHKSSSQLDLCKMILMRGALPILARWVVYIGRVH